jgi:L-ectoine synthase
MKVLSYKDLYGTDREVDCPNGGFKSLRLLLEDDKMGYTLTRTMVYAGKGPQKWHYKKHLETCYCIKGHGILTDLKTNQKYKITPGVAYVLNKHDEHTLDAKDTMVLICVFNPPLKGREVHKKDGSY